LPPAILLAAAGFVVLEQKLLSLAERLRKHQIQ
jgi:hypothetical protein